MPALIAAAALSWAAASSSLPTVGGAQPPAVAGSEVRRSGLAATDLFALADRYAAAGRLDETERLLEALTSNPEPQVRSEALFRLGNVRANRGKLADAAKAYRTVLENEPKAARVRLELARVLYASGDEEGARRQLMRAEATGLPEDVARIVNRFARALRSKRPYGASIEFGFAPDTNINRASAAETVEIGPLPLELDEDAQAQSGVGLMLGGQAFVRVPVAGITNVLVRGSAQSNLYRRKQFNDVAGSLMAGPELIVRGARVRPAALVTKRWFGGESYSTSMGITVNVLAPLGSRTQLDLDATAQRADYRANQGLDGWQFSLSPRIEHAFTPNLFGRLGLRVDRSEARDLPYRTWTVGADALLSQDFGRETLFVRGGLYRTSGDGAFSIAPARQDTQVDAQLGFVSRRLRLGDLSPGARVNYTKNSSPVFFYDYRRLRLELFLSREF